MASNQEKKNQSTGNFKMSFTLNLILVGFLCNGYYFFNICNVYMQLLNLFIKMFSFSSSVLEQTIISLNCDPFFDFDIFN